MTGRAWRSFRRTLSSHPSTIERSLPWLTADSVDEFIGAVVAETASAAHHQMRVRVAHQPNLFPSLGVIAQDLVLEQLSTRLGSIYGREVERRHVIVDYDGADDRRIFTVRVPSLHAPTSYVGISLPGASDRRATKNVTSNEPAPARRHVDDLLQHIHAIAGQDRKPLARRGVPVVGRRAMAENFDHLRTCCVESLDDAATFTDFSTGATSRLLRQVWRQPIDFVSGSTLFSELAGPLTAMWTMSERIIAAQHSALEILRRVGVTTPALARHDAPFWFRCRCGARVQLRFDGKQCVGTCTVCARHFSVERDDLKAVRSLFASKKLLPRVLIDDLLDGHYWDYLAGASYPGGFQHYVLSALSARDLGWSAVPEFMYLPRKSLSRLAPSTAAGCEGWINEVRSGRTSIAYHLLVHDWALVRDALTD